ncbi:hypothetical protein [Celeribacter ethanolicus]|uniref:hypothetical protein n=1 Tax=Celeribacter ethanolicus TaxID=1758178 RepID=UPI0012DED28F|nr:hypothetical protein [Celeribacter ethanolicus]
MTKTTEFALSEWKQTREQIHLLLNTIWRFEGLTIAGYAAFYAWLFSEYYQNHSYSVFIALIIACTVTLLVKTRLNIEYAILMVLADYSKVIEHHIYQNGPAPIGWEHFLTENPPDNIPTKEIEQKYSNTASFLKALLFLNFAAPLVYLIMIISKS